MWFSKFKHRDQESETSGEIGTQNPSNEVLFSQHQKIALKQKFELGELLGFETRNKYMISNVNGDMLGFAAEQGKGVWGFLGRTFLGHWRKYEIVFYDNQRQPFMSAVHPFRWYFHEFEILNRNGQLVGRIVRRFALLSKKFDVLDPNGNVVYEISSPIWKIWTFPFMHKGRPVAHVRKRWSGVLSEWLTDRDNFLVEFDAPTLSELARRMIVASAVFIDIMFFERKAE
ncbi:MAG: hypothetical protein RI953_2605 [Pseudomonadota bacterium]|jgi:uncharacterized protein YxjI